MRATLGDYVIEVAHHPGSWVHPSSHDIAYLAKFDAFLDGGEAPLFGFAVFYDKTICVFKENDADPITELQKQELKGICKKALTL